MATFKNKKPAWVSYIKPSNLIFFRQMKPNKLYPNYVKYKYEEVKLMIYSITHYMSNVVEELLWHGYVWLPMALVNWCLLLCLLTEVVKWMNESGLDLYSPLTFSQMPQIW